MINKLYIYLLLTLTFTSCMDDDSIHNFNRLDIDEPDYGVFIVNEGNFMYSNASLSYYNPKTKTVINDIFYNTNALPLGDVAQSMEIKDSLGFIIINNSGKIYVINTNTFKYVGKITGLTSPRNIIFINDYKAYVSDLYSKTISIINLQNLTKTGDINIDNNNANFLQHNSENFIRYKNLVFTNSWSYDDKILTIDVTTDKLTDSITVGKQPNSIVLDKNNKLWVLCDGGFAGSSYGQENAKLIRINPENLSIEKTFTFDDINVSPFDLCLNNAKDSLFFIYGDWSGAQNIQNSGIYAMSINDENLPLSPLINSNGKLFYSLNINPYTNNIYIGDANNFTQNGKIYRFATNGTAIDTFNTGIIPGAFSFKK